MNHQVTTRFLSRSPLIAVFGCTGTLGSEVMRQLASYDCTIRGILRQPNRTYPVPIQDKSARVSYVTSDHNSVEQLTRACFGANAIFLLIGNCPEQVQIESKAIAAAKYAGVSRIIKLSAPIIPKPVSVEVANWHHEIEAKLDATGIEYCCLRPYAFMQNWLRNASSIRHFGKIIGAAGSSPRNYVDCRDVAAIATRLLLQKQPLPTKGIAITGSEAIANQEMARRISIVTSSPVQYENLSPTDYYHLLVKQARLPQWLAQHLVELEELALKIPEQPTDTIQQILGRFPRTMDEFLQEFRSAFMPHPLSNIWSVFK